MLFALFTVVSSERKEIGNWSSEIEIRVLG